MTFLAPGRTLPGKARGTMTALQCLESAAKTGTDSLSAPQPIVLIVDDNPVDRRLTGGIIQKQLHWQVQYSANGAEALEAMQQCLPSLVVTDMLMPEMDGLELVQEIRAQYPLVPVVLMTAYGSEDLAIRALQQGAASYVPKKAITADLADTLDGVLGLAQANRTQRQVLEAMTRMESSYELENNPQLVAAVVAHLQEYLDRFKLCDETGRIRVGIALEEAITNGINHGNLELSSELRQDGSDSYHLLGEQRRKVPPFSERRIHICAQACRQQATFQIRDEGPGFDPATLPDPTDPANLGRIGGRGLLLIRTFMDEVTYNATGNQITMVKRREGPRET